MYWGLLLVVNEVDLGSSRSHLVSIWAGIHSAVHSKHVMLFTSLELGEGLVGMRVSLWFVFCGGIGIRGELRGCLSLLKYGVPQLYRRWSDGCRRYSLLTDGKLSGGSAVPCDGRPSGSCHLVLCWKVRARGSLYVFSVTCSVCFFASKSGLCLVVEAVVQYKWWTWTITLIHSVTQHVLCYVSVPEAHFDLNLCCFSWVVVCLVLSFSLCTSQFQDSYTL
jgi:hypothetical protein